MSFRLVLGDCTWCGHHIYYNTPKQDRHEGIYHTACWETKARLAAWEAGRRKVRL